MWPKSASPPESLSNYTELVTLPCYEWQHVLVLPSGRTRWPRRNASRLEDVAARAADHLPPVVHWPHQDRARPLQARNWSPAYRWKPSTPT